MQYLLDTNIFIRAKHEMPIRLWPTFWKVLAEVVRSGQVFSCKAVKDELYAKDDELKVWISGNVPKNFFISEDADIMVQYGNAQQWAASEGTYTDAARKDFATVADAYLIATAAARNMTLVTNEVAAPGSKKRIKIPDVCKGLGVPVCDLNEMLKNLRITV